MVDKDDLTEFVGTMMPRLNESDRRLFLGSLSIMIGRNGASELSDISGVSKQTISVGRKEAKESIKDPTSRPKSDTKKRVRTPGGGRKKITETYPEIKTELIKLLDGNTIGNPMSTICWTTLGTENLAELLRQKGYKISRETVATLLKEEDFSLQQNKKYVQNGDPGPDRDQQFKLIQKESSDFINAGLPVLSVDAKKKELIGNYANKGKEYRSKGDPRLTNDHDFLGEGGKAVPYGIYDVGDNSGFVSVGISSDTAKFAVNAIRLWWQNVGAEKYEGAKDILITADSGGSNGRRNRQWKYELQKLSNEEGLTFHVRHYPPGTSKWNKIEHRLFSHISMGWRGQPLTSLDLIVNLISSVSTRSGLKVECVPDEEVYATGVKISDEDMSKINIKPLTWRGDWNYMISPIVPKV